MDVPFLKPYFQQGGACNPSREVLPRACPASEPNQQERAASGGDQASAGRPRELSEPTPSATCSLPVPNRLAGPVQFIAKLLETWKLEPGDAVSLLGLEHFERRQFDDMLSGRSAFLGHEMEDRIACLFHIRSTLSALFRSEDVENEWLRERHSMIDDQVPLCLLLRGSMEDLLLIREYVDVVAGQ